MRAHLPVISGHLSFSFPAICHFHFRPAVIFISGLL